MKGLKIWRRIWTGIAVILMCPGTGSYMGSSTGEGEAAGQVFGQCSRTCGPQRENESEEVTANGAGKVWPCLVQSHRQKRSSTMEQSFLELSCSRHFQSFLVPRSSLITRSICSSLPQASCFPFTLSYSVLLLSSQKCPCQSVKWLPVD